MKLKSIKLSLCLSILSLVVLSLVSQGYSLALAQTGATSLVIDDFSSGAHKAVLKSGVDWQIHEGSMVGVSAWSISLCRKIINTINWAALLAAMIMPSQKSRQSHLNTEETAPAEPTTMNENDQLSFRAELEISGR